MVGGNSITAIEISQIHLVNKPNFEDAINSSVEDSIDDSLQYRSESEGSRLSKGSFGTSSITYNEVDPVNF